MTRRFLLVTYAFPPMAAPEAALSMKRMGNLRGVDVDVVTIRPFRPWMGDDRSLDHYVETHFEGVTRLEAGVLGRLPLGRMGPLSKAPDAFRFFNSRLWREICRRDLGAYDAVVTWGQSHSAHLVGRRLREVTDIPWIAHMSDPWMGNPYLHLGPLTSRWNAALERSVVEAASLLTVTSAQTERLLRRLHPGLPAERIVVLPHTYDPALYPVHPAVRGGGVLVRHLGAFYGPRTPEPLFRGLERLSRMDPQILSGVTVELIGPLPTAMLQGMYRQLPDALVKIIPPVPYVRSLELMAEADLLLIVDAPAAESLFLPSKLIDYIGAKRPIVALTPPGASADVVDALGGYRGDPDDDDAVAAALLNALQAVRRNEGVVTQEVVDRYRIDVVGQEFLELFDRVREAGSR